MKNNTYLNNKFYNLSNEDLKKIIANNFFQKSINRIENSDVNINHLENIFSNETYYLAMKIVPLLERKILYLSYVENLNINLISKRLKLKKSEVIKLRQKGILHFKNNLSTIYKTQEIKNKKDY